MLACRGLNGDGRWCGEVQLGHFFRGRGEEARKEKGWNRLRQQCVRAQGSAKSAKTDGTNGRGSLARGLRVGKRAVCAQGRHNAWLGIHPACHCSASQLREAERKREQREREEEKEKEKEKEKERRNEIFMYYVIL